MHPTKVIPGLGQESVWDYPRPPAVAASSERVRVISKDRPLVDTVRSLRVLETSQAPAYYFPEADIDMSLLEASRTTTFCEWKGMASYWSLRMPDGSLARDVAWSYAKPSKGFEAIAGHLAFYAQRVDECWVGDERVVSNAGAFYGGWITSRVVGPFKGADGTQGW